jgi:hypothetical protein
MTIRHAIFALALLRGCLPEAVPAAMPQWERDAACDVALAYRLDARQTALLLALRVHENGPRGCEFGVGAWQPNHPARRFAAVPWLSFRVQAEWAAGTIRKHGFNGDVAGWAARTGWCLPHERRQWVLSVERIYRKTAQGT